MQVNIKATQAPSLRVPEPWLKFFPPRSAEDMLTRFKKAKVHVPGSSQASQERTERLVVEAYEACEQKDHPGFVYCVPSRDFGLGERVLPYPEFRKRIFGTIYPGYDIRPCAPWEQVMTAITLAETPVVYVPREKKIFCIGDYAAMPASNIFVIESDHSWYWLHWDSTTSYNARIAPDDWVLFRP